MRRIDVAATAWVVTLLGVIDLGVVNAYGSFLDHGQGENLEEQLCREIQESEGLLGGKWSVSTISGAMLHLPEIPRQQ